MHRNLHGLILHGLSSVLSDSQSIDADHAMNILIAACPPIPDASAAQGISISAETNTPVGKMTQRSFDSLDALAQFFKRCNSLSESHIDQLLTYLQHLPLYTWEKPVIVECPSLPDAVTHTIVSALLEVAEKNDAALATISKEIWAYYTIILGILESSEIDVDSKVGFAIPSLTGWFRAMQSSRTLSQDHQIASVWGHCRMLTQGPPVLDLIRKAIKHCLATDHDSAYTRRLLRAYWDAGTPLSNNRIIHDFLIVLRNGLMRNISRVCTDEWVKPKPCTPSYTAIYTYHELADAWDTLVEEKLHLEKKSLQKPSAEFARCLSAIYVASLGLYQDVKEYMLTKGEDKRAVQDGYLTAIVGLSLQIAALASARLSQIDDLLVGYIEDCLFAPADHNCKDTWVYRAALDAATLIAINFHRRNGAIISSLCRFLATPSLVFLDEYEPGYPSKMTSIRNITVRRLAQCIQVKRPKQRTQAAISTFYALLNEITRYNEEPNADNKQDSTSVSSQKNNFTQHQHRQQVCINSLSAIVGIAVYLRDDHISALALSLVLLRRKLLLEIADASLLNSLISLAVASPASVFRDIVNLFAIIIRDILSSTDNVREQLLVMVLDAQTNLARDLKYRQEFCSIYLESILGMFIDIGLMIQSASSGDDGCYSLRKNSLGRILFILQTLLETDDFDPRSEPSPEMIMLLRNMWFYCVLFDFVADTSEYRASMLAIARKTPALVTKDAEDHLESDLEYNTVLAGISDPIASQTLRQRLMQLLPNCQYEIKGMPFAQVVFGLAVYHIEIMRGRKGDCTSILYYYMSGAIQAGTPMGVCMEAILDANLSAFITEAMQKASLQILDSELKSQIQILLRRCCHRVKTVHLLSVKIITSIVNAFPQVFADKRLVTLLFELVQLLWLSCESFYRDEYTPTFHYTSDRVGVTLELGDSQAYRNELCTSLYKNSRKWLQKAMDLTPMEMTGLVQDYLAGCHRFIPNMPSDTAHLGMTLALEIGRMTARNELAVDYAPEVPFIPLDNSSNFVYEFISRRYHAGEANGIIYAVSMDQQNAKLPIPEFLGENTAKSPVSLQMLRELLQDVKAGQTVDNGRLYPTMIQTAAAILSQKQIHPDYITCLVRIPVYIFTKESMVIGTEAWTWILIERPDLEKRVMVEMLTMWRWVQRHRKGLYSPLLNYKDPFEDSMTYTPSNKESRRRLYDQASALFEPHMTWIKFLHSRFHATRHRERQLSNFFLALLMRSFEGAHLMSTHSLSRQTRFYLLLLGLTILTTLQVEALAEHKFRTLIYGAAYNWFSLSPRWHYGPRKSYILQEYKLLSDVYHALSRDNPHLGHLLTSSSMRNANSQIGSGIYKFYDGKTKDDIFRQHLTNKKLLLLLLESEMARLSVWCDTLNENACGIPSGFTGNVEKTMTTDEHWKDIVRCAFQVSPRLAVQLRARFAHKHVVSNELHRLIANNTLTAVGCSEALTVLLGDGIHPNANLELKHLLYWAPVPVITAANYFLPAYRSHPSILQYAMRILEYYPINLVFFYIPQIVQALRYDEYGYVERYIMEAGQISQRFAHQIIWNMQANFYVDADKDCTKPDPIKPVLERIIKNLVDAFTGKDREFYEREFKFFNNITAISGHLKEYIRFGQNEKKPKQKERLDEELGKIEVVKGVYLPSNPDGEVEEIDRTSGRPLQSHAKAPFMATFKIKKQDKEPISLSAIFKVGDDCRQDVLALQLIAVFKNIYTSVGLDLYLYPYRVVATAPGRGVIDVIKHAISRDQLGREKVNSMYDYFVAKYGNPETTAYQRARTNFVQSLAAYSVLSYLLQFKDRHNGNIMLDDEGHIIHIDFGFIFDIAPGGITFESSPFKLTTEMVQVMGGGTDEQAFRQFSELVIKAYLASRPFAERICELVALMIDSGLPCFKSETIKRLRARFQLDRSERAAANFMILRIAESCENQRTVLYDYFQKLTNGIPY
ncbi:hypothetical protein BX666DRAFT_1921765 [Dichotomocladium elegans]|nr:hypothetical protein BX666DRAFT_1921765 [Dichotomocladium elegans]